jgi:hypothetical protein
MRYRLQGSVTIPRKPTTLGGIISWAKGVNRTLAELRDRKIVGMEVVRRGGGGSATGPFCKVYQEDTSWKLLGGTVTGGAGVETVAAITIGTIGTEPADGTFYWLVANVTANEEDGVLLPGCELTSVTTGSGTTVPSNTIPTAASTNGVLHISLGEWMDGKFTPAGCGNIQVSHCPGTLSYARG